MTTLETILASVAGTVALVGMVGYALQGRNKAKSDNLDNTAKTLKLLRDEIDILTTLVNKQDTEIKKQEEEIQGLGKKIAELKDLIELKDQKLQEYLAIIKDKNPELQEFIKLVTAVAQEAKIYMIDDIERNKKADIKIDTMLNNIARIQGALKV